MTGSDHTGAEDVLAIRPFYFMMNFWGDDFRWMFLNLCLASLLSSGNIPSLTNKTAARFLIIAPRKELETIDDEPLIKALRRHIQVQHVEIPNPETVKDKFDLNTYSYKLAAEIAHANNSYGLFLCPDTLLSDGTIVALEKRARAGAKAVLVAALRHDQDGILRALASKDIELGKPLTLPPRALMKLGLDHLHPQAFMHDWDGDTFSTRPGFCLWRVPGSDGLILHTMRWNPLLISYADMPRHETWSRFGGTDHIGMDDDYIFNNFGDSPDVHAVADTDEIAYVSLTPARVAITNDITSNTFSKRICLRVCAAADMMDPLQRRLFRTHIRMHAGPITEAWIRRESEIDRILDSCLAQPPSRFDRFWCRYGARGIGESLRRALFRLMTALGTGHK